MWGYSNIGKQDFIHLKAGHDEWMREIFLKLLECQSTLLDPLESLPFIHKRKKGLHLFANRKINQFKAAVILVNFWTSLGFRGDCKLLIALI